MVSETRDVQDSNYVVRFLCSASKHSTLNLILLQYQAGASIVYPPNLLTVTPDIEVDSMTIGKPGFVIGSRTHPVCSTSSSHSTNTSRHQTAPTTNTTYKSPHLHHLLVHDSVVTTSGVGDMRQQKVVSVCHQGP